jgi:uncharacterized protein YecE (DUF72 family)
LRGWWVPDEALMAFLGEVALLKDKLGVLLVQLPPSLALDEVRRRILLSQDLGADAGRPIAVEPRHASWFTDQSGCAAHGKRRGARRGRSGAGARAAVPLVVNGLAYWRLHGSPVIYRSSYADRIDELAAAIRGKPGRGALVHLRQYGKQRRDGDAQWPSKASRLCVSIPVGAQLQPRRQGRAGRSGSVRR